MLESGKLAVFTDDVSTAPEPGQSSRSHLSVLFCLPNRYLVLDPDTKIHWIPVSGSSAGCRMAPRCAETSSEHGRCHMTWFGVGWRE